MSSPPSQQPRIRPRLEGLLLGVVIFAASAISVGLLYFRARSAEVEVVRSRLERLAHEAAGLVDGDLHATLRDPAQQSSPEYDRALAPLVEFHRTHPDVFHVYTTILDHETVR